MTEEMDSCEKILSARAYLYLLFHKLYGGEPTEELIGGLVHLRPRGRDDRKMPGLS